MTSEKQKRLKWEQDRIAEIRAQTVKGLEPEITKIINQNKDEIRRINDKNNEQNSHLKETLLDEYERKISDLRARLLSEKDALIDRERERWAQKA